MSEHGRSSHIPSSVRNDQNAKLCDAVIKVEDVEFPIHKIILCNCTEYFAAYFTRWSSPEQEVFHLHGLSAEMMRLIIEFAYSGSVSVTVDNVQELLMAADQFNVMGVVKICCDFLVERLCPDNCICIWQLTDFCIYPELRHKAYSYILHHFEEVVHCEEFMQLSAQQLANILDRDDLNPRQESSVFEAVVKWINHAPEERREHAEILIPRVRLGLLSAEYIRFNVLPNELVGGFDGDARLHSAEAYNPQTNTWDDVAPMLTPRSNLGIEILENQLFVVRGYNGFTTICKVESYDATTNEWSEVQDMEIICSALSCCVVSGLPNMADYIVPRDSN